MPQTFYQVLWIFIIYAFIGWCTEVSYAALDQGVFVNRGFLNGPYCPIYGCGVLIVVVALTPLKENLFILFIGSVIMTSILEYFTGYILEKVFHNKWWDYSDIPFNIKGYVCLKFSILWGLACSFIMLVIHPIIFGFINMLPKTLGILFLVILMSAFAADCMVTISTILKFNKRLRVMNEIAEKLKEISNDIGENIYDNVFGVIEKKAAFAENMENGYQKINGNLQQSLEAKKAEYHELSKKYKELAEKRVYGHNRLIRAFPGMKTKGYEESFTKVKENLKNFVKSKK